VSQVKQVDPVEQASDKSSKKETVVTAHEKTPRRGTSAFFLIGVSEPSKKEQGPPVVVDHSAERLSNDNTLKEVPNKMPECDFTFTIDSKEPVFTNDQLL
jgi:hypothetical protein